MSFVHPAIPSLINNFKDASKTSSFHQIRRACQFGDLLLNPVPQASRQILYLKGEFVLELADIQKYLRG